MTINLSDNSPRVIYTVAAGVTQSSFTVPFDFFEEGDVNVYVDGVLKTITTDYTVSGGGGNGVVGLRQRTDIIKIEHAWGLRRTQANHVFKLWQCTRLQHARLGARKLRRQVSQDCQVIRGFQRWR